MIVLTATCQNGTITLSEPLPEELEGKQIQIIVQELPPVEIDRRAFMKLPMAERRRILAAQAEAMAEHYEQDTGWREWVNFAVIAEYQEPSDEL